MSIDLAISNEDSVRVDVVDGGEKAGIEQDVAKESQAGSRHRAGELGYRPFPVKCLPECVRDFVVANAQAMGCDESLLALPALTVMAGAIGGTRRIRIKRSWTEPAILWTAVVANSGTRKSPPIDAATRPLWEAQIRANREYAQRMSDYEEVLDEYDDVVQECEEQGRRPPLRPMEPIAERFLVGEVGVEQVALMLSRQPRGLTVCRDELDGWLGSFDASRAGKGAGPSQWLELHGGRPMSIDRRSGTPRTIHILNAAVSLTGGIQPEILATRLTRSHLSNGLFARLLFAFPPQRPRRWAETDVDPQVTTNYEKMVECLLTCPQRRRADGTLAPEMVEMEPEAKERFSRFVDEFGEEQENADDAMAASFAKLEGYAARFALVLYLARYAAGEDLVPETCDLTSIEHGITLSRWFAHETKRVRSLLCETPEDTDRRRLVGWLQRRGGQATARDLARSFHKRFSNVDEARAALSQLCTAGMGSWTDKSTADGGGRPTQMFVLMDESKTEGGFRLPDSADLPRTDDNDDL